MTSVISQKMEEKFVFQKKNPVRFFMKNRSEIFRKNRSEIFQKKCGWNFGSVPEWSSSSWIPSSRGAAKNVCLNIVTEF